MAALVGGGVDYTFVAGVAAVRAIAQNAPMLIISGMQPYMDYTLIGAKGISTASTISKARSSASPVPVAWRNSPLSKDWPRKAWCATAITRFFTASATARPAPKLWKPEKFRPRRFLFWKDWSLKRKVFRPCSTSASVIPGFPFVVIAAGKQKIETDPEGIVAILRAINRGLDFLKKNPEKVAESVIKKNNFGDPTTVRQVINQFADVYSTSIIQGRYRRPHRRHEDRS